MKKVCGVAAADRMMDVPLPPKTGFQAKRLLTVPTPLSVTCAMPTMLCADGVGLSMRR